MSPQNMDPNVDPNLEPSMFSLSGQDISIGYSSSSIDGKARFSYKDAEGERSFQADEIYIEESRLGTLVTVTTQLLVDVGSNTLTLLLPRIKLEPGKEQAFETLAIKTHNTQTLVRAGASQSYQVIQLTGTARPAIF